MIRTQAKTKKAVCNTGRTAKTNTKQSKAYRIHSAGASENLKELLGVLLLRLAVGQAKPSDWQLFERLLRSFYKGN